MQSVEAHVEPLSAAAGGGARLVHAVTSCAGPAQRTEAAVDACSARRAEEAGIDARFAWGGRLLPQLEDPGVLVAPR